MSERELTLADLDAVISKLPKPAPIPISLEKLEQAVEAIKQDLEARGIPLFQSDSLKIDDTPLDKS